MNDFDLESKLKSVRVPARTEEYWETFPSQVRSQLHPVCPAPAQRNSLPRLAWASAIVSACLVFAFVILPACHVALKDERVFRRELTELPHHLRVLMADEHGMHYLIADQQ
jgi:hypothetical protein